jgi:hypothetical protein
MAYLFFYFLSGKEILRNQPTVQDQRHDERFKSSWHRAGDIRRRLIIIITWFNNGCFSLPYYVCRCPRNVGWKSLKVLPPPPASFDKCQGKEIPATRNYLKVSCQVRVPYIRQNKNREELVLVGETREDKCMLIGYSSGWCAKYEWRKTR